jgi:hypothetical protein
VTRSIKGPQRRLTLLLGAATATTLLMSGCGAGQIAETAGMAPTISGVNLQTADNSFKIRNLAVSYLNTKGYPAGGNAPLELTLFNDSEQPVTVRVSTTSARTVELAGGPANAISPSSTGAPGANGEHTASASPEPSGSAAPTGSAAPGAAATPTAAATPSAVPTQPAPAGAPASIQIPPGGFVILNQSAGSFLQLTGLNEALAPGQSVELIFDVNGTRLQTQAPVAVPLTPAPAATPEHQGAEGGHGD